MLIKVSYRPPVARIALLQGDRLLEYAIWNPDDPDGVGDVYTARITARLPAMAGSFVDLGGVTGFLPDSAGGASLTEGSISAVRITRAAQSGKGPRVAVASGAPAAQTGLVSRGPGPLLELAARLPGAQIRCDDYALIALLRPHLPSRITYQAACFDAVLEDEVAGLQDTTVGLPQGAVMHIAITAALTAIDIDAGAASAGSSGKAVSQLALNRMILPELVRQMILRNLSGAILVDFAGMKSSARPRLTPDFTAALAADPLKSRLLGFSHLGFAEITRPRIRPPLHEMIR